MWSNGSIYMKSLYSPHQRKAGHGRSRAVAVAGTVGEPFWAALLHAMGGRTLYPVDGCPSAHAELIDSLSLPVILKPQ